MKETVESSRAPAPIGPYSQAIADAGLLFMSGQVGRKHDVTELEDGVADALADHPPDGQVAVGQGGFGELGIER